MTSYSAMMASALALLALQSCQAAQAQQPQCGPYATLKKNLAERYHEVPIGGGIVSDKVVMQVFASLDGATWTVLAVGVDGRACVSAAGRDWEPGVLPVTEGERS